LFLSCFATHGALFIAFKTEDPLSERAGNLAKKLWAISLILVVIFWVASYVLTNLWRNYMKAPILLVFPLLVVLFYILVPVFIHRKDYLKAWIMSALSILFFTGWGIAGLFPNILPSSINPAYSLTITNSSSSPLTLKIMTIVAVIFVPIVLAYTFWTYKVFSYRISGEKPSY